MADFREIFADIDAALERLERRMAVGSYSINPILGAATLTVVVDGLMGTTFSYADSSITLSERLAPAVFTRKTLAAQLAQIKGWMDAVSNQLQPTLGPYAACTMKLKKTHNKLTGTYKLGGDDGLTVTDAEFVAGTGETTFAPRAEVTWPWADFVAWVRFVAWFQAGVEEFA